MSPPSNALSEGSGTASFFVATAICGAPPPPPSPCSPSPPSKPFSSPPRQLEVNWGEGGEQGDRLPLSAHSLHLSRPCALASHVLRPGRINQVVGSLVPSLPSASLPLCLTPPPHPISLLFFKNFSRLRLPLGSRPQVCFSILAVRSHLHCGCQSAGGRNWKAAWAFLGRFRRRGRWEYSASRIVLGERAAFTSHLP